MNPTSSFDSIFVISDLHLGGPEKHQIFRDRDLLAGLIDALRADVAGTSALIINGDMVDFLAQDYARYFDAEGAIGKLDDIAADPAFSLVWQKLTEFVRTPNRHLVITLGNHDLELAMPWVRGHLLDVLSGGDPAARARITLSFDGTGYACNVGSARVLCVHGNEVDTWNVTDYEALRRIACDLVQGRETGEWAPNAGTRLVIDVMNKIKRRHAFVDLLKPEREGVVRLLMVFRPDLQAALRHAAGIAGRRVWDAARRAVRLLSDEEPDGREEQNALARVVGRSSQLPRDVDTLMNDVEVQFRSNLDPLDLVYGGESEQLGKWSAFVSAARRREPYEVAWSAVKELASGNTFTVRRIDDDFDRLNKLIGGNFDIVIAGHTHLARILGRESGGMFYNSGTWATLMRLREEQTASPEAFKPVFDVLQNPHTVEDLEKLELVFRRPTVVAVQSRNGRVEHGLKKVIKRGGGIVLDDLTED